MVWPFHRKEAAPPETKSLTVGGIYFGSRLLTPAAASYGRLAREGYGENPVAFACANRIANAVASVELHLFREEGGTTDRVTQSNLLTLLNRPNPLQSGREFLGHLASYYALSGNAYVHGSGIRASGAGRTPPKQLFLLSPGHVTVEPGRYAGIPKQYVYRPDASTTVAYPVDQLSARSEVLHLKTFNPLSPWYGTAPMDAAALAIDMHTAGNVWNYSLLKQGARPSGALIAKGKDGQQATLTDEQFVRLKGMLDEEYSGSGNNGKPLLLEGGLEWQEMSLDPTDMDFLNGKHSAAREIALAFGVPPQLLGIPGDNTYCLPFDARVSSPSGAVKIGDIRPGHIVYSVENGTVVQKPVTWAGKVGTKQTYRIRLTNRDLVATGNHPVLVRHDAPGGECSLEYVKVDDLRPGDVVVIAHDLPEADSAHDITPEEMELFGFYTGDGSSSLSVTQSEGRGYRRGGFVSLAIPREASYLEYYAEVLSRAGGGNSVHQTERTITVASSRLSERLEALGLRGTAKTKRVPSWVFNTSKVHRLAYLRGILDSDGSVDKNGRMSLSMCNLDLITDIWHLALTCGLRVGRIWSREVKNKLPNGSPHTGDMHGFMIGSAESVAEVGTRTPEYLSRIAANLGKEKFLHHWYERGVTKRATVTDLADPKYLSYARVLTVVAEEVCDVYDIEVKDTHNFIADGVVVHNSNYEQATLAFWTETVLPILQLVIGGLNRWLTPQYGDGLYLWYDEEMIPALEPLRKAKSDRVNAASYMKINEKRHAMGLGDADGGDVILVPSSSVPLDLAGSDEPTEPGGPANEPVDPDANT